LSCRQSSTTLAPKHTYLNQAGALIGLELVSFLFWGDCHFAAHQCCHTISILKNLDCVPIDYSSKDMADVSQHNQLLLSECYRGSSPRSASTPGPAAPDSPANSASGRFSASPSVAAALLSPSGPNCFSSNYHYSPYHHHHAMSSQHHHHPSAALGLMGSFLSVGSYPYAALAAAAAAAAAGMAGHHLAPPLAPPPLLHPLNRIRQQSSPTSQSPVSRVLPFSVENILKPEFGRNQPSSHDSTPAETADQPESVEMKPLGREPIKRTASNAGITSPSSSLGNKRVKSSLSVSPAPQMSKKIITSPVSIKADPADLSGRTSSCTDSSSFSSGEGSSHGKDGEQSSGSTELPTDPTKMTDPAKWPAWIFCTRYSDRPSSGKSPLI
jgi:homeobox protein engrailed